MCASSSAKLVEDSWEETSRAHSDGFAGMTEDSWGEGNADTLEEEISAQPPVTQECCMDDGTNAAFAKIPDRVLRQGIGSVQMGWPDNSINADGAISVSTTFPVAASPTVIHTDVTNVTAAASAAFTSSPNQPGTLLTVSLPMFNQTIPGRELPSILGSTYACGVNPTKCSQDLESLQKLGAWRRSVQVFIPATYQDGHAAKVQIIQDGESMCSTGIDAFFANLREMGKVPGDLVFVCVASGDAAKADFDATSRDMEYELMSDLNARFFIQDVLPAVAADEQLLTLYPNFQFTSKRTERGVMGCSSSGASAVGAVWWGNQDFHRAIGFSATLVNVLFQKESHPLGYWEMHSNQSLILNTPRKPSKIYHNANDADIYSLLWYGSDLSLGNTWYQANGYFNLVLANNRTAHQLNRMGYDTLYEYAYDSTSTVGHCDPRISYGPSFVNALQWLWSDAM
jgi:enterochelin esterase-like enzyme